ncbi:MAG: hypothetical protein AAF551_08990 [Bacteroidota bacterium]
MYEIIDFRNTKIFIADFTTCSTQEELVHGFKTVRETLLANPEVQLLLSDLTGVAVGREAMKEAKNLTKEVLNQQILKSAALGAEGLKIVLFNAIAALSTNEIKAFTTREEALAWLTK